MLETKIPTTFIRFSKNSGREDFQARTGWLNKFKKRFGIVAKSTTEQMLVIL